ncbi:M15 family metallopeptidase [Herbiconiux sp. L3-i23]|uniref:M15 family metallopeptidase n=1 Tax=Herbiconiux sp. L3-i23 TaxID=2905871 RepID=UPI00204A6BA9|nr:M15 family metallopeptidase [Herbiconiux sp. L3-i23]BDI21787.1 D-alanyl-D-alanine carboxypeptidase [Herbiconiux sp. L3-i23]
MAVGLLTVLLALTMPRLATQGTDLGDLPIIGSGWSGPGDADGVILDDEIVGVDDDIPAITGLQPALRDALREATAAAALEDVSLDVSSGWRSTQLQEQLFADAVDTYGSEEIARQYVAPADRSSHVTGDAFDLGGLEAQLWLGQHGSQWGLCQTYANERWHFELATTPGGECPPMLLDASSDWS